MAETRQEPFAHATAGQSHAQAHRNVDLHLEPEYRQPPRPSGAFPVGNGVPQEFPVEEENRPHPVARPVSRASSAPGGERGLLNRRKNHMGWLTAQSSQAARPPRCSQTQHTRRADASDIRPHLGQSRAGFGLPGFGGRPHSRECERRPRPVRPIQPRPLGAAAADAGAVADSFPRRRAPTTGSATSRGATLDSFSRTVLLGILVCLHCDGGHPAFRPVHSRCVGA